MYVTGTEYRRMSKKASPPSPVGKNCVKAFLAGGLICALGQAMAHYAQAMGMRLEDARMLSAVALIVIAVALTGLQVYDNLAKHAGAGTLVPITGFANAIVSPAIEFKTEGFIMGLGAKMFVIAGPVLVFGITASVLYGVLRFIAGTIG